MPALNQVTPARLALISIRHIQLDLEESGCSEDAAVLTPLLLAFLDAVILPYRSPEAALQQIDAITSGSSLEFDTLGLGCDVYSVIGQFREDIGE